ncbi:rhodanese-like domain-containing protein [Haloprofundus salinisoli]|uniref:rhodanese-like domain-containing protein n=1 Tax=Haloprofundus salinisoli TaxID=2876193 RepID=UPI001CCB59A0|nr:rhodanese-like domain-containing protein [Haloprofundus salinisoli]
MSGVDERTPEEVRARLAADAEIDLVDIRDREDFEDAPIDGAENVPVDELEAVVEEREWADEVIVSCYIGETSVQAARLIDHYADDAEVASMTGGYEAWDDA